MTITTLPTGRHRELTYREIEVLAQAGAGYTNAAIGRRMHLSEDTIKTHLRKARAKLDAHDRTQAVVQAIASGVLVLLPTGEVASCIGGCAPTDHTAHCLARFRGAAPVTAAGRVSA
ncbi:helix-turn-helix transcriptional regulator [Pseudonocardia sp. NPDC049635]|uniref:response regulator transcription factor n=1 Tax=Pseudonocardia sp. NPDC049635 TaxID=3155506 RepID=UPI0033CDE69F